MKKGIKYFFGVVILLVLASLIFSPKVKDEYVANEMQRIENKVAEDAVKQYEIAKRNGNAIDAYTSASIVCAAYLQAKDEANYVKWKKVEKEEAKLAGMPEM